MNPALTSPEFWLADYDWLAGAGRVAVAATVIGGAFLLSHLLQRGLERLRTGSDARAQMIYIVERLGTYLLLLAGFLIGVSALGVDLGSLTIFGGAIGVGLGLGLQGVVKEFVSGLVLIFDPTIQVGDFVELDDDVRGEIVEIGPRATRLRTNDDLNVVIPNSNLMQTRVTNWTYNDASRRIHVPFSVAEESDIAHVRDTVLAAARALPFTLPEDDDHRTQVWLNSFASDGLDFDLVVWPTPESSRHPRAMHAAYTWAIYHCLRAAGIDNADPRMKVEFSRGDEPARPPERPARREPLAPNDAAAAVVQDADRNRRQREADAARPRRRQPPPD